MYEEMDDVVRGVGQVCISASSLEWSLAYCTSVLRCKGDDWFVDVFASPGQPLKQFRKLTSDVTARMPELRADTEQLLATAEQLLSGIPKVLFVTRWQPGAGPGGGGGQHLIG